MKRRLRTHPSNPYYSTEPAVPTKNMADKPPVQDASLGNQPPKMVPKRPGRSSGFAPASQGKKPRQVGFKPPNTKTPMVPKVAVKPPKTQLRSSGHPGAHRIGQIKGIGKL